MWSHRAQERITPLKRKASIAGAGAGSNVCACVCCFVLLTRYWEIVTVPGSISFGRRPGVVGSSPITLTTSLVIPVPSSSSSNGPSNYSVDNHGLCHGGSVVWAGPLFVRTHR